MSEMVERVARAIFKTVEQSLPPGASWLSCEHQARAAIAAMREPTEAMVGAASCVDRYADPGDEWGPMIDAALSDEWAPVVAAAFSGNRPDRERAMEKMRAAGWVVS